MFYLLKDNKLLLALGTCMLLLFIIPSSLASASGASTLDNDATSTAPGYNEMGGDWARATDGGYNKDYRWSQFTSTSKGSRSYKWVWTASAVKKTRPTYYAYVGHVKGTSPSVAYVVYNLDLNTRGYINQATTPSGFRNVVRASRADGFIGLALVGGSSSAGNAVADAVQIKW